MHSIHDMLQRFRNTIPTPREERRKQQKQGQLQEMWWICDGGLANMDDEREVYQTRDNSEGSLDTKRSAATAKAQQPRSVDRLISEDIEHFLEAESHGADRLGTFWAPHVLPSPNPAPLSGKSFESLKRSPPRGSIVPLSHRRLAMGTNTTILEQEIDYPDFLRHSIDLDSPIYTGSGGLRDVTAPSSSQEETNGIHCEGQAMGVMSSTVVGIASELDVVLENLRRNMSQDEKKTQETFPQDQDAPGRDLPVNLGQIADDLDTKLLEFTLMARARERAASEARTAEDSQKVAWKQGETKRIEEMVRQECYTLRDTAQGPRGGEETCISRDRMVENSFPREDSLDWSFVSLPNNATLGCGEVVSSSTLTVAHPPSASPDSTPYPLSDRDADQELTIHQMADVIQSVEARIKQIQALHVEASSGQDGGSTGHGEGTQVIPAKAADRSKEGRTGAKREGEDVTEKVNLDVAQELLPLPGNAGPSIAVMADADILRNMRDMGSIRSSSPNVGRNLKVARPSQRGSKKTSRSRQPHAALSHSWLYGRTTLEQTGRCIGAELEVAMLCMQKRLEQEPISYGKSSGSTEGETNNVKVDYKDDDVSPKDILIEEGLGPNDVSQQQLQMLTDNMAKRKENHEIDRELGLDMRDTIGNFGGAGRDSDHFDYRMPLVSAVRGRGHSSVTASSPYLPTWVDHNPAQGGSQLLPLEHAHLKAGATCIPNCNPHTLHEMPHWALATNCFASPQATLGDVQHVWQEPSVPLRNPDLNDPVDSFPPSGVVRFDGGCAPARGLSDTVVHAVPLGHRLSEGIEGDDNRETGFSLARARRRLQDIQKARTSMSSRFHSDRGAHASSIDTQGVPQPIVEAHLELGRLRRMRSRYASHTSPQNKSKVNS